MTIKNKVAVITGSSRGIGRETAIKFAEEGCNVVINYNKNKSAAELTQSLLNKKAKSIVVKADVGKPDECKKLIDETISFFKKIDILVNNAGINPPTRLEDTSDELFDRVIGVNVKSTYFCTKYAVPYIEKGGRIINLSSIRAYKARPNMSVYEAAKAAVSSLTRSLAYELAARGISVNAVAPGYIETDMINVYPRELLEDFRDSIPFKRIGSPEEVAELILFLASSKSNYITGQTIVIDGGHLI